MSDKSNWVVDTRPENIDTYTETSGDQAATYKLVDTHPIIGKVLDKLAFFRTHAAAVWYNKLAGKSVKDKLEELDEALNNVSGTVETVDPMTATVAGFAADALKTKEVIAPLQTKMASFEQAKSNIIGSALGQVLGMNANTELSTAASKIVGVINRGTLNWSSNNTTYSVSAGYYTGGTLDSRPSYNAGVTAADARVNSNSANYKGGYNAGVSAQDSTARSQLASALVSVGISAAASETFAALLNKVKTLSKTVTVGTFKASCSTWYYINRNTSSKIGFDSADTNSNFSLSGGNIYISGAVNVVNVSIDYQYGAKYGNVTYKWSFILYKNGAAVKTVNASATNNGATTNYSHSFGTISVSPGDYLYITVTGSSDTYNGGDPWAGYFTATFSVTS